MGKEKYITISGHRVPCRLTSDRYVYSVFNVRSIAIPKRSGIVTQIEIEDEFSGQNQELIFEPEYRGAQITSNPSIVEVKSGVFHLPLLNLHDHDLILPAGTKIGTVEEMSIVEDSNNTDPTVNSIKGIPSNDIANVKVDKIISNTKKREMELE